VFDVCSLSITRSTPHAMFAISSRRNSTSSTGRGSTPRTSDGGSRKKPAFMTELVSSDGCASWNMRQLAACAPDSAEERMTKRSPRVLVTTSESARHSEPTGNSIGMTNRSLQ
jgi:hypothetical protein